MTYDELLEEIRNIFMQADVSGVKEHIAYQFNIEGEAEGAFYAEVQDGQLTIEPYEYFDRDVMFTTSAETLLKIVRGEADPVEAFTFGRLKVEGDFDKALMLSKFSKGKNKAEKKQRQIKAKEEKPKTLKTKTEKPKTEKVKVVKPSIIKPKTTKE